MEQFVSMACGGKVHIIVVNGYCKAPYSLLTFYFFPLGNVDIMLEAQCLSTLGRILFDFNNEFIHQGKRHVLKEAGNQLKTSKARVLNKKTEEQVQFYML